MVKIYCSLLLSRKEVIKFSEVALVSVHRNYLIGWIVTVKGYRSWNTNNTKMDIYLLVENGTKKTKHEVCSNFFSQPFGCTKVNFGSVTRRQPHSMLITVIFQVWPELYRDPPNKVGSHSMTKCISAILNATCYRTKSVTPKMYLKQLTI